jgi:hypothetical protein
MGGKSRCMQQGAYWPKAVLRSVEVTAGSFKMDHRHSVSILPKLRCLSYSIILCCRLN